MRFTTSWDDGHPLDLRLADLLNRYQFPATFYVPLTNREGLPVLSASGLRELDTRGELGSHTLDHCYLTTVDREVARQQIRDGRVGLEDAIGHRVAGFCYPGGKFRREHVRMVQSEGFAYARTTRNMEFEPGSDPFQCSTTVQFYPHARAVYLSNWVKHSNRLRRMPFAVRAFSRPAFLPLLESSLLHAKETDGTFHVWGHSWELDSFGGWALLEQFLAFAEGHVAMSERMTNGQLLETFAGRTH